MNSDGRVGDGQAVQDEPTVGLGHPDLAQFGEEVVEVCGGGDHRPDPKVDPAGEVVGLDDSIIGGHVVHEGAPIMRFGHVEIDGDLHGAAEGTVIENGSEVADDAALDQAAHPHTGGVGREPDPLAKVLVRYSAVGSENADDSEVKIINHRENHCSKAPQRSKQCHLWREVVHHRVMNSSPRPTSLAAPLRDPANSLHPCFGAAATPSVDEARFARLTAAWNDHQELRRTGASVGELAESRRRLDAIRFGVEPTDPDPSSTHRLAA